MSKNLHLFCSFLLSFLFFSFEETNREGFFLENGGRKKTHDIWKATAREMFRKKKKKQHEYANRNEKSGFESSLLVYTFGCIPELKFSKTSNQNYHFHHFLHFPSSFLSKSFSLSKKKKKILFSLFK